MTTAVAPIPTPTPQRVLQSLAMTGGLEQVLHQRFALEDLYAWQREAIDALLSCGRVLVVAPTGGGKSLCYQLPAAVLPGTAVVISPLIALMDDQVRSLGRHDIPATYLASTLPPTELAERERGLRAGRYKLVYLAPERLHRLGLIELLTRLRLSLVAVDEAHCISQWGHDFRPDYLQIGRLLQQLRPPRVLACTATATPTVRAEILERLGLPVADTALVLRGFARPNLHLAVEEMDSLAGRRRRATQRIAQVLGQAHAPAGAAIVYAGTRRQTDRLAAELVERGWRCAAYHAGLPADERERTSERFAARDVDVVVATNAFGMGIDRPDIRLVVHLQAPGSLEQYYQEVGRAGRDRQPAHGLLLGGSGDFVLRRRLIERHDELTAERRRAQWQLFIDLMRYAEAGSCRHDYILRYFGDESETLGGCGHCDVCERLEQLGDEPGGEAVLGEQALVVRKALSGVARLRRRAGLSLLAASLHGNDTQRLRQLELDRLSTHGLLADYPLRWITALLRRLVTAGLVELTGGDYPTPFLTSAGRSAMMGESSIQVVMPPRERKRRSSPTARVVTPVGALEGEARALFDSLRAERLAMAREAGVPAYVVCHDRTLAEIATRVPRSLDALAEVHGMGPARLDAHGDRLLGAVLRHVAR